MTKIPYTFSGETLSAFVKNRLHTIPSSHPGYEQIVAYLGDNDDHIEDHVMELIDMKAMISRLTAGKVRVVGETVFYNGAPVHSTLTEKLVELLNAGQDAGPWARFLDNVMKNPTERARECLYNFLAHNDTPLTEDGCFVAWKYVRSDFGSAHANKDGTRMDNSPGKTVEMSRDEVNPNPTETCTAGLHVCASPYLGGYNKHEKIVKVKVNPRDVVAVPVDYNFQKMRTCRYHVLEEVTSPDEIRIVDKELITADVSQMEGVVPEELKDLPTLTTEIEFNGKWARNDNDPHEGSLVAKKGFYLIGKVTSVIEDYEDEGFFDEDGDWIDEPGNLFWVYTVIWQNGILEEIVMYESDDELCTVEAIPEIEDADDHYGHSMDRFASDEPQEGLTFTNSRDGKVYTPDDLKRVQEIGQRAFCRDNNIARSTLQGWLAKL